MVVVRVAPSALGCRRPPHHRTLAVARDDAGFARGGGRGRRGGRPAPSHAHPLGRARGGGCDWLLQRRGVALRRALAVGATAVPERTEARYLGKTVFN